jgi:phosphatidylinositol alpha-1,6-mannosyltransferase
MQRMATELHAALDAHPSVELSALLLRTSWRWTHVRMVPFGIRLLRQIPRVVEKEKIDVVLFSSLVTAALAVPLHRKLKALGARMAAVAHGLDVVLPLPPYQHFVPRVLSALDLVLANSRATGSECLARGLPEEKLHVIPCGVDPQRFPPPDDHASMRRALLDTLGDPATPLLDNALLLCSAGRHVERKGFAWFVEHVMPLLPPDVHYWLAGEGPSTEAVRRAVERQRLQDRVRLLGRISDDALLKLYRGADLFVMPNISIPGDMEGFGIVMLEAGLSRLPTVAARLEGIQDVIHEGENGHLVGSGDAEAFARIITQYYNQPDMLGVMSDRAALLVEKTFSWSVIADQYVRVFRSMAEQVDHGT